jgi:hypothetical protein
MILDAQAEVEFRLEPVGRLRLCRFIGVVEGHDVGAATAERAGEGGGEHTATPELAYGQSPIVEFGSTTPETVQLAHLCHGGCSRRPSGQVPQAHNGGRSGNAIGYEARVALEVEEGTSRVRAKDSVYPTGIEAEASQSELQVGDVVAPEHRCVQVQVAVTQVEARLDQGCCRGRVEETVFVQAPLGLEAPDTGGGCRTEDAGLHFGAVYRVAHLGKAPMEVADTVARVSLA